MPQTDIDDKQGTEIRNRNKEQKQDYFKLEM